MSASDTAPAYTSVVEAARRYASQGIAVLPMHWPSMQWVCSCGCAHPKCWRRAKHPLVPASEASLEPETFNEWWERWPDANIGVSAANLLILDADLRDGRPPELDGLLERWSLRQEEIVACRTGSGGFHFYFQRPAVKHSKGKDRLGRGLDVQSGPGDFVVAPPSRHYNLNPYEWLPGKAPGERPLPPVTHQLLADLSGLPPPRWVVHVAPYWVADRLHLSVETRHRIRRLLHID